MTATNHATDRPGTPAGADDSPIQQIRTAILSKQRFLITSHARPDGDSIG